MNAAFIVLFHNSLQLYTGFHLSRKYYLQCRIIYRDLHKKRDKRDEVCWDRGSASKAQPPQALNTTPQEDVAEAEEEEKAEIKVPKGALASVTNGCKQELAPE